MLENHRLGLRKVDFYFSNSKENSYHSVVQNSGEKIKMEVMFFLKIKLCVNVFMSLIASVV